MKTKLLLPFLFICVLTYAQFPTNGLIAYHDFSNGSLLDQANGNNFTQTGSNLITLNDRFATASNAVQLNGDYLTKSDVNFGGTTHNFTITWAFWVKTTTDNTDVKTIIDDSTRNTVAGYDSDDVGYYIYLRNGLIGLSSRYYEGNFVVPTQPTGYGHAHPNYIADGNWHHVVVTYNPTLISGVQRINSTIYIDGVANSKSSIETPIVTSPNTNGNVTVANSRSNHLTSVNVYQDELDDIFAYNRVLTQAEVAQLGAINGYCFTPTASSISSSSITNATADISISNSGTFDIAYHKLSEPFANATILNNITTGSVTLSSLEEFTTYNVYIREICSGNTTGWSTAHDFTTTRTIGRIYVNHAATGNNNGISWTNAYTNLENALANAENNEEIWVASGTYTPDTSDRDLSFNITDTDLKLYGGFTGTESNLSERDFRTNITILSGDLSANDDATIEFSNTTRNDNSYNIITVNANNAIIDGFTISGAHANGSSGTQQSGGGIFKGYTVSNLDVYNCKFENNVAIGTAAALFSRYDTAGTLKVHSCTFANNLARHGTTVYFYTSNGYTINAEVINSLFYGNTAKNNGGTVGYAGSAGWFRAIGSGSTLNCTLLNNTYYGNQDLGTASGLNNFNRGTIGMSRTSGTLNADVANCIFWGNTTTNGVTSRAIAEIHTNLGQNILVDSSIDQNNFASITPANVSNSNNSDPLFTDASNNDFTLQPSSPAIDAGNGNKVPAGIITDLAGNPRFYNGAIDMGVYEKTCTSTCYTLTLNIVGNGHVENSGSIVSSQSLFDQNTVLSLVPVGDTGFGFYEWSGDATGNANPLALTMDSDKTITVTFTAIPLFVDKDATGANDGSSWVNAFTDLQSALAAADANTVGIWVADGTYKPGSGRSDTFNITVDGLEVYGGFNGTETLLSQRDVQNNLTILSGDVNGNDTGVEFSGQNRTENNYHVVSLNANNIVVDGFTIQDGQADGTLTNSYAGGIFVSETSTGFTLKNSTLTKNVGLAGGAIRTYFNTNASVTIEGCKFDNNLSRYASGIYFLVNNNRTVTLDMTNCLFTNNVSKDQNTSARGYTGSSAWIRANGTSSNLTTTIANCTFTNNVDIGTQSGSDRGTLALGRRTDGISVHTGSLVNSIIYNNKGAGNATTLDLNAGHVNMPTSFSVYNSIGEEGFSKANSWSLHNISSADPLFTDSGNEDFTLQLGSPAIDAGDNGKVPSGVTTDLLGNTRIHNTTVDMGCYERINLAITISPKAFLQGAMLNNGGGNLMRDDLRVANYIPTTSPYTDALTCNVSVFTATGNDAIVDWVFVELRDKNDNTSVLHSQSALLQRDGDVVDVDGTSSLSFNTSADDYYVAIKHRNHLGIISSTAISLSSGSTTVDFTDANNQITHGTNAQTAFGMPAGVVAMWAGNVSGGTTVRYQGSGNDTNTIKDNVLAAAGNTTNSNLYSYTGYDMADVNLDGTVKYQGSGNDANTLKDAVLAHPDNQSAPSNLFIITEQLP